MSKEEDKKEEKIQGQSEEINEIEIQEEIKQETTEIEYKEQDKNKKQEIKIEENKKTVSEDEKKEEKINDIDKKEDKTKLKMSKKTLKTIIIVSILIIILGLLSTGFALLNMNNSKAILGLKIEGVEIQGLSKEQTINILKSKFNNQLDKEIILKNNEFTFKIIPSEFEASYSIEKAVDEAYKIGKDSNIFVNNFQIIYTMIFGKDIKTEIKYDKEKLEGILQNLKSSLPDALKEVSYYIEEEKLIITKGEKGNSIDEKQTIQKIIQRLQEMSTEDIEITIAITKPKDIDIEKIYNEVCTQPKDAYYIKDPFQIFPEVNGVEFDLENAKEILKENKEEYEIPLTITIPKITIKQIGTEAFPDLLSSFSTNYYASNISRSTNLQLAAAKINGTVVGAGETFSYNKTVGERTIAKGYKEALRIFSR